MEPIDPTVCPRCGAEGSFRELGKRYTWQPVTLEIGEQLVGGPFGQPVRKIPDQLVTDEYGEFDYGEDVEVTGFNCRECEYEWSSLGELYAEMVVKRLAEELPALAARLAEPLALQDLAGTVDAAGQIEPDLRTLIGFCENVLREPSVLPPATKEPLGEGAPA